MVLQEWQNYSQAIEGRTGTQVAVWQTEVQPMFNRFLGRTEYTSVDRIVTYIYRDHDTRWLNVVPIN